MEVARAAPRRPCDFTIEVNGSKGTVMFSYAQLNELWVGNTDDDARLYGLRRVRTEHPSQPETAGWWPIGQGVGYDASLINQVAHLAATWSRRAPGVPTSRWARTSRRSVRRWNARSPIGAGCRSTRSWAKALPRSCAGRRRRLPRRELRQIPRGGATDLGTDRRVHLGGVHRAERFTSARADPGRRAIVDRTRRPRRAAGRTH